MRCEPRITPIVPPRSPAPWRCTAAAHRRPALLVEDAWRDCGLGTRLLRGLAWHVFSGGWDTLYGLFLAGDGRVDPILRHADVPVYRTREGESVTAWAPTRDLAELEAATAP